MQNELNALILNHKNAEVSLRELVALNYKERQSLNKRICEEGLDNFLIVSTCNRTELYFNKGNDNADVVLKHLKEVKELDNNTLLNFDLLEDNIDVITHLMRMSIGLESLILGDLQIFNQTKIAYQEANKMNLASSLLHRLMHTIFYSHKKIVQDTEFKNGTTSVSFHVACMMKRKIREFVDTKVIIIGAGEISKGLLKNFKHLTSSSSNDYKLYISNRTDEKAQCLAARHDIDFLPFKSLYEKINDFDIIVSAVNVNSYLINEQHITQKSWRHKYFFDLGIPRTISPKIEELKGYVVYNIDEIRMVLTEDKEKRKQSIHDVQAILDQALQDVLLWSEKQQVSSAINILKVELEKIRDNEIKKHLDAKQLTPEVVKEMELLSKAIMHSVINFHLSQFNSACKKGDADNVINLINDLFEVKDTNDVEEKVL